MTMSSPPALISTALVELFVNVSTDVLRYALRLGRRAGNLALWYANPILPTVSFT